LHFVLPFAVVRQHVTKPGFPQVDRAAHLTTADLHCFGNVPLRMALFAICVTQRTNLPWSEAPPQSHSASAAAAIAEASAASGQPADGGFVVVVVDRDRSYPITSSAMPSGDVPITSTACPVQVNAFCTCGAICGQAGLSQSPESPP